MLPEETRGSGRLGEGAIKGNERRAGNFYARVCSWGMASFLGFQLRPLPCCICGPTGVGETRSSSRITKPSWNDILSPNRHCLFAKRTPRVVGLLEFITKSLLQLPGQD